MALWSWRLTEISKDCPCPRDVLAVYQPGIPALAPSVRRSWVRFTSSCDERMGSRFF